MTTNTSSRRGVGRFAGVAIAALAAPLLALTLAATPAAAQSEACQPIAKLVQERAALMQRFNTLNKASKKDPAQFCALFQQMQANITKTIPELELNGSWCHVPDTVLPGLKAEQPKINQARAQACKVAADQKKMMEAQRNQQQRGPGLLGGGDGIVGGPIRMPSGAL